MKEVISSCRPEPTNNKLNMKEVIRFQNSNGFRTPASKFPLLSQMTKSLIRFQNTDLFLSWFSFITLFFPVLCLMNQLLHDSNSIFPQSFIHDLIETESKVSQEAFFLISPFAIIRVLEMTTVVSHKMFAMEQRWWNI
ncbi:hypothetical protein Hdeb2414_s0017g00501221 [Helianthus debilis subsp. tardiflorus]